jgi:hypothetical protein
MKKLNLRLMIGIAAIFGLLIVTSYDGYGQRHNRLTRAEKNQGWILLFDGKTTDGWRGYNYSEVPEQWGVKDGILHTTGRGRDLIYDQKLLNFHLKLDWNISERGNSGLFILGQEIEGKPIWHTAPEIQIIDNERYENLQPAQYAPALYDLIVPPVQNTRPAGQWNTLEVILNEGHLTIRQNGEDIIETQMGTPEWNALVEKSKFPDEIFGQVKPGYIGLQDHGNPVSFRNIKLRKL